MTLRTAFDVTSRFVRALSASCFVAMFFMLLAGCGKYGAPLAPEVFSPRMVEELAAGLEGEVLVLTWRAPSDDLRARPLNSLDGYRVYRKMVDRDSQLMDDEIEFDLLSEVPDRSFAELEQRQDQAREMGLPGYRVRLTEEFIVHEFRDETLKQGDRAFYKIIPFNQGGVEGAAPQVIRVVLDGARSQTTVLQHGGIESDLEVVELFATD